MPLGDRHPPKQEGIIMSFCTLINCMDGRVQTSCNNWIRTRFGAEYVDTITAPGPVKRLASGEAAELLDYVRISVEKHGSRAIAIAAHPECAGNPVEKEVQLEELRKAVSLLKAKFPEAEVVALWVELNGTIEEIC